MLLVTFLKKNKKETNIHTSVSKCELNIGMRFNAINRNSFLNNFYQEQYEQHELEIISSSNHR